MDALQVRPVAGTRGAEIEGVDLSKPLDAATFEALHQALLRSGFRDEHHPRVEIHIFAGDPLIDGISDDMGDPPPILGHGEIAEAHHLLLGENIPQAELDPKPSIGLKTGAARYQCLGADDAPIGETRLQLQRFGGLDEGLGINRPEQARTLQIGGQDAGQF